MKKDHVAGSQDDSLVFSEFEKFDMSSISLLFNVNKVNTTSSKFYLVRYVNQTQTSTGLTTPTRYVSKEPIALKFLDLDKFSFIKENSEDELAGND